MSLGFLKEEQEGDLWQGFPPTSIAPGTTDRKGSLGKSCKWKLVSHQGKKRAKIILTFSATYLYSSTQGSHTSTSLSAPTLQSRTDGSALPRHLPLPAWLHVLKAPLKQSSQHHFVSLEPLFKLSVSHLDWLTLLERCSLSYQEITGFRFLIWRSICGVRSFQQTDFVTARYCLLL